MTDFRSKLETFLNKLVEIKMESSVVNMYVDMSGMEGVQNILTTWSSSYPSQNANITNTVTVIVNNICRELITNEQKTRMLNIIDKFVLNHNSVQMSFERPDRML